MQINNCKLSFAHYFGLIKVKKRASFSTSVDGGRWALSCTFDGNKLVQSIERVNLEVSIQI